MILGYRLFLQYLESLCLRILDKSKALVKLEEAGMNPLAYKKFTKGIKAPYGIMVETGALPGKWERTTTLYGALKGLYGG